MRLLLVLALFLVLAISGIVSGQQLIDANLIDANFAMNDDPVGSGGCPPFCLKSPDLRNDFFQPYFETALREGLPGGYGGFGAVEPWVCWGAALREPWFGARPAIEDMLRKLVIGEDYDFHPFPRMSERVVDWDQGLSEWRVGTPFEVPVITPHGPHR